MYLQMKTSLICLAVWECFILRLKQRFFFRQSYENLARYQSWALARQRSRQSDTVLRPKSTVALWPTMVLQLQHFSYFSVYHREALITLSVVARLKKLSRAQLWQNKIISAYVKLHYVERVVKAVFFIYSSSLPEFSEWYVDLAVKIDEH